VFCSSSQQQWRGLLERALLMPRGRQHTWGLMSRWMMRWACAWHTPLSAWYMADCEQYRRGAAAVHRMGAAGPLHHTLTREGSEVQPGAQAGSAGVAQATREGVPCRRTLTAGSCRAAGSQSRCSLRSQDSCSITRYRERRSHSTSCSLQGDGGARQSRAGGEDTGEHS
jgi:hypothetical protein